jgi:arsenate reductase-like glutaredoxin family protein
MATMQEIERLTADYAAAYEALAAAVMEHEEAKRELARRALPRIRKLVIAEKERRAALGAAIEASPELFTRPRTVTLHGVRVGYMKAKGRIVWDDEAAVIARIRKLLPEAQAELLIRVKESVHKPAVYDLTAGDLKRLGIQIEGDGDEVLIRSAAGEVDKLIEALLKEAPEEVAA